MHQDTRLKIKLLAINFNWNQAVEVSDELRSKVKIILFGILIKNLLVPLLQRFQLSLDNKHEGLIQNRRQKTFERAFIKPSGCLETHGKGKNTKD